MTLGRLIVLASLAYVILALAWATTDRIARL